jgi:hypothetical protein
MMKASESLQGPEDGEIISEVTQLRCGEWSAVHVVVEADWSATDVVREADSPSVACLKSIVPSDLGVRVFSAPDYHGKW